MKLNKIIAAEPYLEHIVKMQDIPASTKHKAHLMMTAITPHIAFFHTQRENLLGQYCEKNENGEFAIDSERQTFKIKRDADSIKAWNDSMTEILSVDADVSADKIPFPVEKFPAEWTAEVMFVLTDFVDFIE